MRYLILLLIFCSIAEARYRAVPLMPPPRNTAAESTKLKATKTNSNTSAETLASIQFGMYGGGGLSSSEAFGLQWLWGGKIDYRISVLTDRLRIRPSLGYFRKSETEGSVSIAQNVVDIGLGADWLLIKSKYADLSLGLLNHVDLVFSNVSLYGTSGTSPLGMRYRLAPLVGTQLHLSKTLVLAADLEYGMIPQTARTYGAWSLGIAFPF